MWYFLYNLLLLLASPFIVVTLMAKKRCRRGLLQRLGLRWGLFHLDGRPLLWIHAVSLGEVVAAVPLVRGLRTRFPGHRIVVTTVTETGREAVEQRLAGEAEHAYAPLDFPWAVSRALKRLKPVAFLFLETELWPNLLRALARRQVPTILINGRLSTSSFRGYRLLLPFMRQVLSGLSYGLMQSDRDVERIIALGASPSRILRTGNIKFDQPLTDQSHGGAAPPRSMLVTEQEELIVAGSTHPGEEEQLLMGYEQLLRDFPALVLLLAPRHIERAAQVEAMVRARGLAAVRRTALNGASLTEHGRPRVIILDTRGELAAIYRHALLCFVGGTLIPVGGHNLLEPAHWGKPVFFGPYTDHCTEMAELLIQSGGAQRVGSGLELAIAMAALLRDREALQARGRAARTAVLQNRGVLERSLAIVGTVLEKRR